jgi:acyl-CoA thioesterase-1
MTTLRYVALGDSYTIGTGVREDERWPNQLVRRLGAALGRAAQPPLHLAGNLGVNGFTSRDVIDRELPRLADLRPEFASLLIGVNDVVQGVPPDTYRRNVEHILDAVIALVPPERILAVGTPDYTVTRQGAAYGDPRRQSAAIATNNAALRVVAERRRIAFVDVFGLSLRAAADLSLVADDDLHPSGAQYALWVDAIEPMVRGLLGVR